ncbi:hypothetical protein DL766_001292 [Monosporascus sp. MC13-8B]|uniref:Uncharacterized protein n=1 Tax=Monosporascus cannonballus TaxID=155416 RepID=A0ABY0H2C4_9PEZI|nr:hypothetical protein DL762_007768 [Monosporascus cannonballus]RYO84026.1 hypothetical protein DL763_007625 [Monosporascus cannonballus]RYP37804.1 hypothetical protein DL766_001292 [Monosporascus sp. MC13-8B]
MGKKSRKKNRKEGKGNEGQPSQSARVSPAIVRNWEQYFGAGDLQDWQRLMEDLGFDEQFNSKTKCRKALKKVWVNICDFLEAVKVGEKPYRFRSEFELAKYTRSTRKIYPRKRVKKGSPLCSLLANILS